MALTSWKLKLNLRLDSDYYHELQLLIDTVDYLGAGHSGLAWGCAQWLSVVLSTVA